MTMEKSLPVTVVITHYQCQAYIRQAVESILNQTRSNLTLVVVNDGDPNSPWPELAHIDDGRLVRFDLPRNYGLYFAVQVVLAATDAPFFALQDADDWSEPPRIARLLAHLCTAEADLALSAYYRHQTIKGEVHVAPHSGYPGRGRKLTEHFQFRAMHMGLYRSEALRRIGGYYGGFRVSYDMLLTNLMLMTGKIAYVDEPLYHRRIRPASLTTSQATGFGSPVRVAAVQQLRQLYRQAFALYTSYQAGAVDAATLVGAIRALCAANVPMEDRQALAVEANSLRTILRSATG